MVNIVSEFGKKIIGNLNKVTLLQLIWVISIYYFVLNSVYGCLSRLDETINLSNIDFILKYNQQILKFLNEYEDVWSIFTMLLFFSSIIVMMVSCTVFENYDFIKKCSSYGVDLTIWSTIIYTTYKLYMCTGIYYSIILTLISFISQWIKDHKNKFGINL